MLEWAIVFLAFLLAVGFIIFKLVTIIGPVLIRGIAAIIAIITAIVHLFLEKVKDMETSKSTLLGDETNVTPSGTAGKGLRIFKDKLLTKESTLLKITMGALLLIGIMAALAPAKIPTSTAADTEKQATAEKNITIKNTISPAMELMSRAGVPQLYSSYEAVEAFYKNDSKKLVALDSQDYKESTIVSLNFDRNQQVGGKKTHLNDIQLYPEHSKDGTKMSVEQALKIADMYLPWQIIDEYCEFDKERSYICYDYDDGKKKESHYGIRYPLKEKYNKTFYSRKEPFRSVCVFITTDAEQNVTLIHIFDGWRDIVGRMAGNEYKKREWEPVGFHRLPAPPPIPDLKKFIARDKKIKLLGSYDDIAADADFFGEDNIWLKNKDTNKTFGYAEKKPLLSAEIRNRPDKSPYAFSVTFNVKNFPEEMRPDLAEAIRLAGDLLPTEIIDKHYELLFSRRRIRKEVSTSDDSYIINQVVYERVTTKENREEIKKYDYPNNIRVFIVQDYDENVKSITLDGYRFSPEYNRGNRYTGQPAEKLSPYEDKPGSRYENEMWPCPF